MNPVWRVVRMTSPLRTANEQNKKPSSKARFEVQQKQSTKKS